MADGGVLSPPAALKLDSGDTAWQLTAAVLVLLMSLPGCGATLRAPEMRWRGGKRGRRIAGAAAAPHRHLPSCRPALSSSRCAALMPRPRRVCRLTLFYGGLVRAKNVLSMFNSAPREARCAS